MKKILFLLTFVALSIPQIFAQPFTDSIALLKANIEKTGGDKWGALQSAKITASIKMAFAEESAEGTLTQVTKFPGHQRVDYKIITPMGEMNGKSVITPEKAWMENDMMGKQDFEGEEKPSIQALKDELRLVNNLEDLTFALADETLDGKTYYAIKVSEEEELLETRYYDKETLLLYATKTTAEEFENITYFSDYQTVEGVTLCFLEKSTLVTSEGNQDQEKKINTVEFNVTLDETLFSDNG